MSAGLVSYGSSDECETPGVFTRQPRSTAQPVGKPAAPTAKAAACSHEAGTGLDGSQPQEAGDRGLHTT
eukprot:36777-Eustigmatos_ZCMA.PRE.1